VSCVVEFDECRAFDAECLFRFKRRMKRTMDRSQLENLIYHITIEALALHQQGRNVSDVCFDREGEWRAASHEVWVVEKEGKLALGFERETAITDITNAIRSKYREQLTESEDQLCLRMSEESHKRESVQEGVALPDGALAWKRFSQLPFPSREVKLAV
jgi:hypothetical protein